MTIKKQLKRYVGKNTTRNLYRSAPWVGGALALATVSAAVRRRGGLGATVENALGSLRAIGGRTRSDMAGQGDAAQAGNPPQ